MKKPIVTKRLGWIWVSFCAVFAGFGIYLAACQHLKLTRFQPVEATVLSTKVESRQTYDRSTRRTSVVYHPIVHYQYKLADATFTSKVVFPMTVWRSNRWARSIVKQFEEGQRIRAYYNPQNPGDAFLVKQATAFPYFFILLPTVLGTMGLAFVGTAGGPMPRSRKRLRAISIAAGWYGIGLLSAGHYFALGGWHYDTLALLIFGCHALVGLMPICYALPEKGIGGRMKAGVFFSLFGALFGLFGGLFAGWVADLIWDHRSDVGAWVAYGVMVGAGLCALLGLLAGKATSH